MGSLSHLGIEDLSLFIKLQKSLSSQRLFTVKWNFSPDWKKVNIDPYEEVGLVLQKYSVSNLFLTEVILRKNAKTLFNFCWNQTDIS